MPAWATDCAYTNGWSMRSIPISSTATIRMPRDVPVGTVLHTIAGPSYPEGSPFAICPTIGTQYGDATSPYGFDADRVFRTNVEGIGVIVLTPRGTARYPLTGGYDSYPTPGLRPITMWWENKPIVQYVFVKTGPVTGGTVRDGDVPTVTYSLDRTLNIFGTVPSGINLQFVTLACSSPDIVVDMGDAEASDFAGVGTRTAIRPFHIELTDCPAGLNGIRFSLAATNGVANATEGVFALSTDSTATGVGIQVKYAGYPVRYDGTLYAYGGYAGAGTYNIPFEASYYQTQAAIAAGTANGQLEFIMRYE